ncbi:MAG: hypothetical protein LBH98_10145 [Chitinispirillales bacterium]|jgi:hypothetical protein|nr:hypothetical protein [Chitinispirillales bacterium]
MNSEKDSLNAYANGVMKKIDKDKINGILINSAQFNDTDKTKVNVNSVTIEKGLVQNWLNSDSTKRFIESQKNLYKPQIEQKIDFQTLTKKLGKVVKIFRESGFDYDTTGNLIGGHIKVDGNIQSPKKSTNKDEREIEYKDGN